MATPCTDTINRAVLDALPVLKLPPTYRLQDDPGNGCYLDPPGYPTYFTRHVYTAHGNTPPCGAEMELFGHVVEHSNDWRKGDNWDSVSARKAALMRRLYLPLPFEHPRVAAWIVSLAHHFAHCFRDVEREEYGKPGTLIFPVPNYKLKHAHIDEHWTEEYKAAKRAEVDAFNRQEVERATRIATVDNHLAVIHVREIYPEWTPTLAELAYLAAGPRPGDWWERHTTQPSAAECQPPRWFGKHHADGWCQFCGHTSEERAV